jgi:hypothetical protein
VKQAPFAGFHACNTTSAPLVSPFGGCSSFRKRPYFTIFRPIGLKGKQKVNFNGLFEDIREWAKPLKMADIGVKFVCKP